MTRITAAPRAALTPFVRGPGTWADYLLLGFYSFLLNGLGVFLPFLRDELDLSYAETSLHSSAFAVGLLLASVVADRLETQFGRLGVLWGGALGMALGSLVLALAPAFGWSLLGTLLMGTLGSLTLVGVSADLSERHGSARGKALTEANALASFCAILAPVAVAGTVLLGIGWRAALLIGVSLLIAAGVTRGWRDTLPGGNTLGRTSLSGTYWRYWLVLLIGVAVEFCIIFWVVDFLRGPGGLRPEAAAAAAGAFPGAMLVGRALGSRVHLDKGRLITLSFWLVLAGFLVYWLVDAAPARIVGLAVAGLGVANLYPATMACALASVPGRAGTASARASLASGIAILGAPLLLGSLADALSLSRAQALVPLLVLLALLVLKVARSRGNSWNSVTAH